MAAGLCPSSLGGARDTVQGPLAWVLHTEPGPNVVSACGFWSLEWAVPAQSPIIRPMTTSRALSHGVLSTETCWVKDGGCEQAGLPEWTLGR
jgi:hypothetical protein